MLEGRTKEEKKGILIYTIELLAFSLVFLVLAILMLFKVIKAAGLYPKIFTWVSLFGSLIIGANALWTLISKKRRAKKSLFDALTLLPLCPYLLTVDLIALITIDWDNCSEYFGIVIPIAFLYIAAIYIAQAFFHIKYPLKELLEDKEPEPEVVEEIKEEIPESPKEETPEAKPAEKDEE